VKKYSWGKQKKKKIVEELRPPAHPPIRALIITQNVVLMLETFFIVITKLGTVFGGNE
jgi:hypothetical protein